MCYVSRLKLILRITGNVDWFFVGEGYVGFVVLESFFISCYVESGCTESKYGSRKIRLEDFAVIEKGNDVVWIIVEVIGM